MELINNLPSTRLTTQKLRTIDEIVHSPLFLKPECRTILLKKILVLLKQLLEVSDEVSTSFLYRILVKHISGDKIFTQNQTNFFLTRIKIIK